MALNAAAAAFVQPTSEARGMFHGRVRKIVTVTLPLGFIVAALWLLRHELHAYHLHDVFEGVAALSWAQLAAATACTVLAYLVLTGYDWLGFRYIQRSLPIPKLVVASFVSYALSYNLGHTLIMGGSVRYRLYSAWGLPSQDIATVLAFCILTFWVGVVAIGGGVFLWEPEAISAAVHLPIAIVRPIGCTLLALVVAYLLATALRRRPVRIRVWEFSLPSLRLSLAQLGVTCLDLALAGTVLYILLPANLGLSFTAVIGIYLIAIIIGLVSQVPGGLGVFETAFLHLLPTTVPGSAVIGALLAYRGVYYLLPLAVAAITMGGHELYLRRLKVREVRAAVAQWVPMLVPNVLAFFVLVSGAILLFSGATPGTSFRLHWLSGFVPLPVLELSHFLGSLVGAGLILLAHALQRRLNTAYWLSVLLLCGGIPLSLLKGLDYEEAVALAIALLVLIPCRGLFYRRTGFLREPFAPGWIATIGVVLACAVWLGLFSYKHVEYSHDQWWRFALDADAPRFMRATVGAVTVILIVAARRMLQRPPAVPSTPSAADLETVEPIVAASDYTVANLALLGDKALLFNEKRSAFLMYGVEGRSWIAMGEPIGPKDEHPDLIWRFHELADRDNGWTVFYQIRPESLPPFLDLGLTLLKLGEEARVPLVNFTLEGGPRKGLRQTTSSLERKGCSFELLPVEATRQILPELKAVSDEWLTEKNTREKRFSVGFFSEDYLIRYPIGVVRIHGRIVAFANVWLGAHKEEVSVDLMRHASAAPNGVMDYLFVRLMLWGQREGYHYFDLGMAPLTGLSEHPLAPFWNRVGAFISRRGEHYYNFEGLRQYKEKFDPEWEPRYLASPGGLALPRILGNLATLIAESLKGVVAK